MATRTPTPRAQLSAMLSRFPRDVAGLAKRCLQSLRRAVPGSNEIAYDYPQQVVVSFSMSDRGYEAVVAIAVASGGVRLYFDRTLPDPDGILEGTGGKVRSVGVTSAAQLDRGAIRALIVAAKKRSGARFRPGQATTVIIKAKPRKLAAKGG